MFLSKNNVIVNVCRYTTPPHRRKHLDKRCLLPAETALVSISHHNIYCMKIILLHGAL